MVARRLALVLFVVGIACLVSCGKKGIGKITAPRVGGAGQWVNSSGSGVAGPEDVIAFAFSGTITSLFALKRGNGVWRSTDNGVNWVRLSSGLSNHPVYSLTSSGATLFAGTDRGVYRSRNNGASWEPAIEPGGLWHVTAFAVSGTTVIAGGNSWGCGCSEELEGCCFQTVGRVYRSIDNGQTWTEILPGTGAQTYSKVTALALFGGSLFMGTEGDGVFGYDGVSWTPANDLLTTLYVRALAVFGGALFAGTDVGVFRYSGTSWTSGGLAESVNNFTVLGSDLFAATDAGVFHSTGGSWTPSGGLPGGPKVLALAASGTTLFAGTLGNLVFRSSDNGARWSALSGGTLSSSRVFALALSGTTLFAGGDGGVFRSADNGATWTNVMSDIKVLAIAVSDQYVFAGGVNGVYRSDLNGNTWTPLNITNTVSAIGVRGDNVFVGAGDITGQLWRSTDDGNNWTELPHLIGPSEVPVTGISMIDYCAGATCYAYHVLVGVIYVGDGHMWYLDSSDNGATWGTWPEMGRSGVLRNVVSVSTEVPGRSVYYAGTEGFVWYTFDFEKWGPASYGLPRALGLNVLAAGDRSLYAGTVNGVFRTTDLTLGGGSDWTTFSKGLSSPNVHALVVSGSTVFAGTDAGVWKSPVNPQ